MEATNSKEVVIDEVDERLYLKTIFLEFSKEILAENINFQIFKREVCVCVNSKWSMKNVCLQDQSIDTFV